MKGVKEFRVTHAGDGFVNGEVRIMFAFDANPKMTSLLPRIVGGMDEVKYKTLRGGEFVISVSEYGDFGNDAYALADDFRTKIVDAVNAELAAREEAALEVAERAATATSSPQQGPRYNNRVRHPSF